MKLWLTLTYSKQRKTLSSRVGGGLNEGRVSGTRWEWGIGKGDWKRQVRAAAKDLGLEGRVRPIYGILGSRYSFEYNGSQYAANSLYAAI